MPYHFVGTLNEWDEIRITRNAKRVLREKRVDLQRAWSETSYQMQTMRDNPSCAQQEFDRILDLADPGLTPKLTFDPQDDFTKVYQDSSAASPRVAILREQGVNSHYEMAAAFDKAGFASVDVHMSDILSRSRQPQGLQGPGRLRRLSPMATCSVPASAGRGPS